MYLMVPSPGQILRRMKEIGRGIERLDITGTDEALEFIAR